MQSGIVIRKALSLLGLSLFCGASSHQAWAGSTLGPTPEQARAMFGPLPDKMPGAEKDTPELVHLGGKLFHDPRLSVNGTQSCNTCHRIDSNMAGVDNEPTSAGALGTRGNRNSPTTLNAGFQFAQFWDGRAPTLEHQAIGPIFNPVEMALPNDDKALERLRESSDYPPLFEQAFPEQKSPLNYQNAARAIAAFERTLITRDRFDDFQKGTAKALTARELKGLRLFLDIGCVTCHSGPVLGGNQFQKVGLIHAHDGKDEGRFAVTKNEEDKQKFKVPMLRNIALTAPYFHDGKVATLDNAVKTMAWEQLDKRLDDEDVRAIVAFLNTLTDKARTQGKPRAGR